MSKWFKGFLILGIMTVFWVLVPACGGDDPVPTPKPTAVPVPAVTAAPTEAPETVAVADQGRFGGTIKIAAQAGTKSLDPSFSQANTTHTITVHIFENLFAWDRDYNIKNNMVDKWEASADGLTLTFTLRDGLMFHDGSPVTSDDVVASLDRWLEKQPPAKVMKPYVAGIAAVDDTKFTISLTEPFSAAITLLGSLRRSGVIWPKEIAVLTPFEDVGLDKIIGSGPYKVAEWKVGDKVVLERADMYNPRSDEGNGFSGSQISYLDRIEWLEIPNEETKIAGLKTGQWDVVDSPSLDVYADLNANPDINVSQYKPGHVSTVLVNHSKAPMNNKKLRQAIQAAIDAESMMLSLGGPELWDTCAAIWFCGTPNESTAGAELFNQNDMEKAKRLLAESGYDGEPLTLMNPTDYATITPTGPVFKAMLEEIGINVDMPAMDWSTQVSNWSKPENWHMQTIWCVHNNNHSPINSCMSSLGSFAKLQEHDRADEIGALNSTWASTFDPVEKAKARDDLQALYYEEALHFNWGQFYSIYPYRTWVKNFDVRGIPWYGNVWIEK
jgi:peptide/nickel transport system substrate-binding protein